MILSLLQWFVRTWVHLMASFLAAILSHEDVQDAGSRMMVRAMNEFLRQPDLNEHVRAMSETMAKNQEDYARSAGQDFPKLAGQFIQGMLSPKKESQAAQGKHPQPPHQLGMIKWNELLNNIQIPNNKNNGNHSNNNSPKAAQAVIQVDHKPAEKGLANTTVLSITNHSDNNNGNATGNIISNNNSTHSSPARVVVGGDPPSPGLIEHKVSLEKPQPPKKLGSFLQLPQLGGLPLGGDGLRHRLGSGSRAS